MEKVCRRKRKENGMIELNEVNINWLLFQAATYVTPYLTPTSRAPGYTLLPAKYYYILRTWPLYGCVTFIYMYMASFEAKLPRLFYSVQRKKLQSHH